MTAVTAQAASFEVVDLYSASGSTGNITLIDRLRDAAPWVGGLTFTSTPDSDTFVHSLSSGVLYGKITCDDTFICGSSGSSGYFSRRAPTGSSTISSVTFIADPGSRLAMLFGTTNFLVVIGNQAGYVTTYQTGGTVAISANATGTAIAEQLDTYFGISTQVSVSSISAASQPEGTDLVHTVTLSATTSAAQDLVFSMADTTTSPADYGTLSFSGGVTLSGTTLTIPAGLSSFTITVAGAQDYLEEGPEAYALTLGGITATGTITDDDHIAFHGEKTSVFNDLDTLTGPSIGDTLSWKITVSNDGNVPLTDLHISSETMTRADHTPVTGFDERAFLPATVATLAPGASTTFTATYVLSAEDVDAGGLSNTATVAATPQDGSEIYDVTDNGNDSDGNTEYDASDYLFTPTASIALIKTATLNDGDGTPGVSAGDNISYAFTVANSGAATLTDITVTDPMVTVSGGPLASLAPGATDSSTFHATYVITQADLDAGLVSNSATVSAKDPAQRSISDTSGTAAENDDSTDTPLTPTASIALIKTATLNDDDGTPGVSAGDSISYAFSVTNTGAATLTDITVTDPMVTVSGGPLASLAPGATDTSTFHATYVITQADLDAGLVSNSATVSAKDPAQRSISDTSGTAADNDDSTDTPLTPTASIALIKTATLNDDDGTPGVSAGDSIDYIFSVANTGSVTLTQVSVLDPMVTVHGAALTTLAPGEIQSTHFSAHYIITAADVTTGSVSNQATASGTFGGAASVDDLSGAAWDNDDTTITFLGSIAGTVADTNGVRPSAIVRLIDAATGSVITEVTTDASGRYSFIGIEPGTFCISFAGAHSATEAVRASTGSSDLAEPQGDAVCGIEIVLGANRAVTGVDAIMVDPSGIIYDAVTRSPIGGATVTLLIDGSVVPDSWLSASGDANNVVTGSDGLYSFLLQSPATSGTYTLRVTAPGYETSTLLPAETSLLVPATGLGVEAVVPFTTAPAIGQDTTHYLGFGMSFPDWSDATSLSKGIIHNHIPLDPTGVATALSLTKTADASGLSSPAQVGDVIRYTITAHNSGALPISAVSLDDPLTSDETLVAQSGVSDDGILGAGETWVWTASLTLDASLVNREQIDNLATLTLTDAWGAPQILESSPTGNASFGAGNGVATTVTLAGLVDEIRDELAQILRADLEDTLARLGRSFSGYARGASDRLRAGVPEGCEDQGAPGNDFSLSIQDGQINADGGFERERYNCVARVWRIDSVEISATKTERAGTQTILSYTHRIEKMPDDRRLNARFFGVYGSHSEIATGTAEGTIDGLGVFGGLYGARRLAGEGMLDYYLGAAAGRHGFSFDFARSVTISAEGNYQYFALLAGSALSRDYKTEHLRITPRLGFDLAYAPGAQVSVTASQGARSQSEDFALGDVGTWRLFLETEFAPTQPLGQSGIDFNLTPAFLCEGGTETGTGCGLGLTFGLEGQDRAHEGRWSAELDLSATDKRRSASLSLDYARRIDLLNGEVATGLSGDQGGIAAKVMFRSEF